MRKMEKGRSMVEMLGVLAIIGVLSVGGIYGYSVAMNKYKANEVVQAASMLGTLAIGKASTSTAKVENYTLTGAGIATADAIQGCTPKANADAGATTATVDIECTDSNLTTAINGIVSGADVGGVTIKKATTKASS